MAQLRLRRVLLLPLLAGLVAVGAAAWLLLRTPEVGAGSGGGGRAASRDAAPGPTLQGLDASRPASGDAAAVGAAELALAGRAREEPREELISLRLVDRAGQPLAFARATFKVLVTDARGTRVVSNTGQADAQGRVSLFMPSRRVLAVEVLLGGGTAARVVASFDGGTDAAELEAADLVALGVEILRVRTVDGKGRGIPDRRVVYRPRVEGVVPTGWWGDRSDMNALLVLGPFESGSLVELAPGPRSTGDTQRHPGPWQAVRVDGSEAEVIVGDEPRLRLRIAGLSPAAEVSINGTLQRLEAGVWTGSEVDSGVGLDVMVGPLSDGRFAFLRSLFAEEQPIDVELEAGARVTGRLAGGPAAATWSGTVTARGRSWSVTVPVHSDGSFVFPGLPSWGGAVLQADIAAQASARAYKGSLDWSGQPHVDLPLVPVVQVKGQVQVEGRALPHPAVLYIKVVLDAGGREWSTVALSDGTFSGSVPAGFVSVHAEVLFLDETQSSTWQSLGLLDADRSGVVLTLGAPE